MPMVLGNPKKAGTYKGYQIYKTKTGMFWGEKFFGGHTGKHSTKALLKKKIDALEKAGWF